jgi:hypothetical protein
MFYSFKGIYHPIQGEFNNYNAQQLDEILQYDPIDKANFLYLFFNSNNVFQGGSSDTRRELQSKTEIERSLLALIRVPP